MRQIDNMTPQEIDTLKVKGMLADNRTIPAEKPTVIKTEMSINECSLNVVKALEEAQAHADKLAEAIRDMMHDLDIFYGKYREPGNKYLANLKAQLSAYEADRA